MKVAWVLGSGGLLGAALCRSLRRERTELFFPAERFDWHVRNELCSQITTAVQAFACQINPSDRWEIYWAAGVGTMGSAQAALAPETRALALLLRLIETEPRLMAATGAVAFASSAGAIYAGSKDTVITENTLPAPTTDYAREKLKQEDLIRAFVLANIRTTSLLARISTIYGPGQDPDKQQGLLTHMARRVLQNQPIQIYVPFDTIRDYIAVDNAADEMVSVLGITSEKSGTLTKIIASEHPATIAEIISTFKKIARRAPRIVTSASSLSALYSRRVQFHSITLPERVRPQTTSLLVGIAQLIMAERSAFVRGPGNLC